jgi:bacterioferritin-associated ferredoxin
MFLTFKRGSGRIDDVHFASNGCGWAVAAAEVMAEKISGAALRDLHGLEHILKEIVSELGEFPAARERCVLIGLEALRKALADHRERAAEEWTGEKALICTCFGISEETIAELASAGSASVEDVGIACGAGTGCGSCQMLIREILEEESAEY